MGKCHSQVFSLSKQKYPSSESQRSLLITTVAASLIHRRIISPKSPKALILFISMPHKKRCSLPAAQLMCTVRMRVYLYFYIQEDQFRTRFRNISSCTYIKTLGFRINGPHFNASRYLILEFHTQTKDKQLCDGVCMFNIVALLFLWIW